MKRQTERLFMLLLLLNWPLLVAGTPVFPDCGYYKMPVAQFQVSVQAFADAVQARAEHFPALRASLEQGASVTQDLYQARLIDQQLDCIHDPAGLNVEVVGGDALGKSENRVANTPGFTLIVRGLPAPLCNAVKGLSSPQRTFRVRPEIPNRLPGAVGDCVNNSVVGFLKLPMPNTLYVFQPLNRPSHNPVPDANPSTPFCPVHPDDQIVNDNNGKHGPCVLVEEGIAGPEQMAACNQMTADIRRRLTVMKRRLDDRAYADFTFSQRLELIRPLFQTYKTPSDPAIARDRWSTVVGIFTPNGENNVDPDYWAAEQAEYDRITQAIQAVACKNNWSAMFTSQEWQQATQSVRVRILHDVHQAFTSVKALEGKGFFVDRDGSLTAKFPNVNGIYIQPNVLLPEGVDATLLDSVLILFPGYQHFYAGVVPSMRHGLETVLEELMHAYQFQVSDQYISSTLPRASNACTQAPMFFYNVLVAAPAHVLALDAQQLIGLYWDPTNAAYRAQPFEVHAKKFAQHVTDKLLDGRPLQCP